MFFHITGIQKVSSKVQLSEFTKQLEAVFYPGVSIIPKKRWFDRSMNFLCHLDVIFNPTN